MLELVLECSWFTKVYNAQPCHVSVCFIVMQVMLDPDVILESALLGLLK
jgi:hypothetical protein